MILEETSLCDKQVPGGLAKGSLGFSSSPQSWNRLTKFTVSFGAFLAMFTMLANTIDSFDQTTNKCFSTFGNSAYTGSILPVQSQFHVSETLAISPISLYAVGFIFGPMLGSSLSEVFGRQYVYKASMILCLSFTIVAGAATHFRILAVARAFAGFFGSPAVTILAALRFDLYAPGDKMGELWKILNGIGLIWATELGPFAGGAIVQALGWRWSFYLTAILLASSLLIMLSTPETFLPELMRKHSKTPRQSLGQSLKTSFWRPLHMLLVEPIMLPTSLYLAWCQVILFVFYVAYPFVLIEVYAFSLSQLGLAFLPLFVGTTIALPILSIIDKRLYQVKARQARENGEAPMPELRLFPSKLGAIMIPIALFW